MNILKEFAENVRTYGGIRKLFSELEKVSPEYADKVEEIYIHTINEAAEGKIKVCRCYDCGTAGTLTKALAIAALKEMKNENKRMYFFEEQTLFADKDKYINAQRTLDGIIELIDRYIE